MARTILRAHSAGIHFYLNSESSSPNTGHRNRYRLFKTENHGAVKSGWIQVGSVAGQELIAIGDEKALFEACERLFASKHPRAYQHHGTIRGKPGRWEGVAFPNRKSQPAVRSSEPPIDQPDV
ncbi:hypothetical protein KVG96_14720 [Pseudomonas sp. COR58]|uniref:Uncharacterized protein n=1 Tax=Pseudomonas ekonensis TaxID=2842353 RepID=A0ABS6PFF2_9PSED|nr:hypothetical protein [Pseudomonas ekonensis]MBV4459209.1 hypothetical protein [Pseudomonas ekonensis]